MLLITEYNATSKLDRFFPRVTNNFV